MAIYLIRHGETAGNAERVVQTPEMPLSRRGVGQAERLGSRLAGAGIAGILASDLARAAMTAEHLAAATGAPLALDPVLQERNFGAVRGTPYAELDVDLFAPDYAPPRGETWQAFDARVDRAWARVRDALPSGAGSLAVVTHGLVCHSLVRRHLALPPGAGPPMGFANASLTIVEATPPWSVTLLNCTEHLADRQRDRGGG